MYDLEVRALLRRTAAELHRPTAAGILLTAYTRARVAWSLDLPDSLWLPLVCELIRDEAAVLLYCAELAGETEAPRKVRPVLLAGGVAVATLAELELEAEAARAARQREYRAAKRHIVATDGQRQRRRRLLRTCPETRRAYGLEVGAREVGAAMKGATCPACGDRSVWWWVEAARAYLARCNHGECGWAGTLEQVGGAL